MRLSRQWMMLFFLVVFAGPALAGEVLEKPPTTPDPASRYMFYMHGRYVEERGSDNVYKYDAILRELADKGFTVVGEARGQVDLGDYARLVAGQMTAMISAGVPAGNITVAGHSRGGFIALLAASFVGNPDVRYGILAACGLEGTRFRKAYRRLLKKSAEAIKGKFLVMWEQGDEDAGHCDEVLEKAGAPYRNVKLTVGGGHRIFYKPEASWLGPLVTFAKE
jgi:hypothetical protein